jgi:hypothetical protein
MVMGETRRDTEAEAAPNQPEIEKKARQFFTSFWSSKIHWKRQRSASIQHEELNQPWSKSPVLKLCKITLVMHVISKGDITHAGFLIQVAILNMTGAFTCSSLQSPS